MAGSTRAETKLATAGLLAGRYRFDAALGEGRFGRVVRVRDELAGGALRALKGVAPADGARLLLEHEVLSAIAHPHLATVHEVLHLAEDVPMPFGLRAGSVVLVETFVDGEPADRAPCAEGAARVGRVLAIARDVLAALAALHARGLAHGDVKAENVLVDAEGRATLIDLGLARRFGRSGHASGTPRAMAPEAWLGVTSPGTDLYALGVMLIELLSEPPFGASRESPVAPGPRPAPALDRLGAAVPEALRRCLVELVEPSTDLRLGSAREARAKLRLVPGQPISASDAIDGGAPSAAERAASALRPPYQGSRASITALVEAIDREPLVSVRGAPGSGRTRLVEEAVLVLQRSRAATAGGALTYVRGDPRALAIEPSCGVVLHVEDASPATLVAARRLLAAARIASVELRVVLESASLDTDGVPMIAPAPLDLEGAMALFASATGVVPPRALASGALERSGGRAGTLARALVASLRADVDLGRPDAASLMVWADAADAGCGDAGREALGRLAVAGGELPASCLPSEGAGDLLAAGTAWLTPEGRVAIAPTLAARVRATLSPEARQALARALPLEALDEGARAHVRLAGAAVEDGVAELVAHARRLLAHGEAGRVVERLEPVLGELGRARAPALALALAEAERMLGRYERAEACLDGLDDARAQLAAAELARLRGDRTRAGQLAERACAADAVAGEARLVLARLAIDRGDPAEAEAHLARIDPEDAPVKARRAELVALLAIVRSDLEVAERAAARAYEEALRASDRRGAARLAIVAGSTLLTQGRPALGLPWYERAVALAERAGELHLLATAQVNLGLVCLDLGVVDSGRRALEAGARTLARLGRDADVARALYNLAHATLLTADVAGARRFASLARDAAVRAGDHAVTALLALVEGDAALREGRIAEAAAILVEGASKAAELPPALAAQLVARTSPLLLAAGRRDDASRLAVEAERYGDASPIDVGLARLRIHLHDGVVAEAEREARELARTMALRDAPWEQRLRVALAVADAHDASGRRELAAAERAEARRLLDHVFRHVDAAARRRLREQPSFARALAVAPAAALPEDPSRWRALATQAASLLGEHRASRLAEQVLRVALSITAAERAFLVERDGEGRFRAIAALGARGPLDAEARGEFSRSICARGFEAGRPIATHDADLDERLAASASVHTLALRSVAFVAMPSDGDALLGLYVEDRQRPAAFVDEDLALLAALAQLSSAALAVARKRREERRRARRLALAERDLRRTVEKQTVELASLRAQAAEPGGFHGVVAESPIMLEVMRLCRRVARADVPVLIHGESGTGKELIARALHAESPRAAKPFIAENCGAIPEPLLESALFGHVKGAFTGADRSRVGLFEAADGGTLFLDEVGEMSAAMQVRLLRVLSDGEVRPVGSTRSRRVDVRLVTASHRDLEKMVASGSFREDLFFRIAVVRLEVPPLRERTADIPRLVAHFLAKHGAEGATVTRAAMERLLAHPFPGNVRELENEVQRALVLSDGEIRPEHLSPGVRAPSGAQGAEGPRTLRAQVDALERRLIREALALHQGNQSQAAKALGVSRYGLQKMITRLGLR